MTRHADNEPNEMVSDFPDPQAFMDHGSGYARPKKQRVHHDHPLHVNINSLLDVLSVILVFLMKSYSSSSVQIKPSPTLQVPFSHSSQAVEESTAITITLKDIMVDDLPVLAVDGGGVPENMRQSGGLLIQPLFEKLQEAVDHQKKIAAINAKAEFKGIVTIIADRNVPFSLLTQVMYTAGQAQYGRFKFAAIKSERR